MAKAFGSGMTELTKAPALNENRRISLSLVANDQNVRSWENNQFLGIGAAAGSQGIVANIIGEVVGNDTLLSFQGLDPNPAGSFTIASITVDAFGRITAAANGGGGALTQFEVRADFGSPTTIVDGNTLTLYSVLGDITTVGINSDILEINLNNIGPDPSGSYQVANITVDDKGRITLVASGPQNNMVFTLAGDGGPPQLIENTQTITLTGLPEFIVSRPTAPGSFIVTPIEQPDLVAGTYLAANVTVNTKGLITEITEGAQFTATFDLDGDSGPTQTISSGNSLNLIGAGTIDTSISLEVDVPTATLELATLEPTPEGVYTAADITVNQQGLITAASDGTVGTMDDWILEDQDGITLTVTNGDTIKIDGKQGLRAKRTTNDVNIRLVNSGVAAGTYTNVDLTVNQRGLITTAADGTVGTMSTWLYETAIDIGPMPPIGDTDILDFSGIFPPTGADFGLDTTRPLQDHVQVNLIDRSLVAQEYAYPTITVTDKGIITSIVASNNMYNFTVAADEGVDRIIENNDTFTWRTLGGAFNTAVVGLDMTIELDVILPPTTVTNATITVDGKGRITDADSGVPGGTMSNWIMNSTAGPAPQTIENGQTVNFDTAVALVLSATVSNSDTLTLDIPTFFDPAPDPIQYPTIIVGDAGLIAAIIPTVGVGSMDNWVMNTNGGASPQTIEQGNTVTFVAGTGLELTTVGGNNWGLRLPAQGGLTEGDYQDAFLTVNDRGVITAVASGLTSFNIEDDDGTVGDVTDGDTLTMSGDGADTLTAVTATDTVTLSLTTKAGVVGSYNVADIIVNGKGLITTIAASAAVGIDDWVIQANGADDQTITNGDTLAIVGDGIDITTTVSGSTCQIDYVGLYDGLPTPSLPGAYGPTNILVTAGGMISHAFQNTPQAPGGPWVGGLQRRQNGVLPDPGLTQIPYDAFGGTEQIIDDPLNPWIFTTTGILYNQAAKDPAVPENVYIGNKLRDFTTINSSSANYKMTVAVLGGAGTPEDGVNRLVGPGFIGQFMHNPIDGGASDIYPGTVVFIGDDNDGTGVVTGDIGGANNTGIVARILGIALTHAAAGETFHCCMKGICTAWWDRGSDAPFGSLITCQPRGAATPTAPPRGGVTVGRAVPDGNSQSTVGYNYVVGTSVDGGTGYSGASWDHTILVNVNPGIIAV